MRHLECGAGLPPFYRRQASGSTTRGRVGTAASAPRRGRAAVRGSVSARTCRRRVPPPTGSRTRLFFRPPPRYYLAARGTEALLMSKVTRCVLGTLLGVLLVGAPLTYAWYRD